MNRTFNLSNLVSSRSTTSLNSSVHITPSTLIPRNKSLEMINQEHKYIPLCRAMRTVSAKIKKFQFFFFCRMSKRVKEKKKLRPTHHDKGFHHLVITCQKVSKRFQKEFLLKCFKKVHKKVSI